MLAFPTAAAAVLSVFSCVHVAGGARYWVRDMSQDCYKGSHLALVLAFGLPGLLFIVLGAPLQVLLLLLRIRGPQMFEPAVSIRYLFLYHSYTDGAYVWEAVRMVYQLVLVLVQVVGRGQEGAKRIARCQAVVVGYMFILLSVRPYRYNVLLVLEAVGCFLVALTTHVLMLGTFDDDVDFMTRPASFTPLLTLCMVAVAGYLLALAAIAGCSYAGLKLSGIWGFGGALRYSDFSAAVPPEEQLGGMRNEEAKRSGLRPVDLGA